ncbi:hypothetical protein OKW76_07130 [Sphingomonas sp. S1-29]|uniref:hypothetical protein n=1 Tax=Sphingomonas sp. S1-29 TaxID=2991074 RepID=UPI00223FC862|nr:hypothetical protein [Sphingomonas sp. S1-29]UZK70788.1 hypothetical protein OKW76_07130 [Sphingomonas sp. S1-29]
MLGDFQKTAIQSFRSAMGDDGHKVEPKQSSSYCVARVLEGLGDRSDTLATVPYTGAMPTYAHITDPAHAAQMVARGLAKAVGNRKTRRAGR